MFRFIGIPQSKADLESMGASFDISRDARQIVDGIWLTGEIPRITEFEKPENYLLVMDPTRRVDPLLDDQALVLDTKKGLLIILGCAHSGMINTIEHAKNITGIDEIAGIIGGTHLGFPGGDKAAGKSQDRQDHSSPKALRIWSPCGISLHRPGTCSPTLCRVWRQIRFQQCRYGHRALAKSGGKADTAARWPKIKIAKKPSSIDQFVFNSIDK